MTQHRLAEVGIGTEAELRRVGAEEAWRRLRFAFGKDVTLNALYALEAALVGCDWRDLAPETKERRRDAAEAYRRRLGDFDPRISDGRLRPGRSVRH